MARIREKTLKFPGLDNTYTFADEADLFDANVACAVGEYRIYNGDLYCCTTAHTGSWDASHFKAVKMGSEVSGLKTAISKQEYQVIDSIADTGYIKTNEATVDITSVTASGTWRHLVMPCKQDDYFVVTGRGGNSARCYCFIDNAGNNIFTALSNELANHAIYTPTGATKVVFNFNANYSYSLVCGKTVYQSQKDNNDMLSTWFVATTGYEPINNIVYGAVPRLNGTIAPHPQAYYYEDSCTAGEKYLIRSTGFTAAFLEIYTTVIFMDGDTVVSYRNDNISKEVITVPDGATTIRVSGKTSETDYCLKQIGDLSGFYSTYEAVEPNADIGG